MLFSICNNTSLLIIFVGNLFLEMGWFDDADKMFYCVLQLCRTLTPKPYKMILLCHTRYLPIDCWTYISVFFWHGTAILCIINVLKTAQFCKLRLSYSLALCQFFVTTCRLLHVRTANCKFSAAKDSYEEAVELASQLQSSSCGPVSWIPVSLRKCQLLFAMNHYREVMYAQLTVSSGKSGGKNLEVSNG